MMRKILSGILIMVLLVNTGGYFLLFQGAQVGNRLRILNNIKKRAGENLAVVVIPTGKLSKIKWMRQGKEFEYGNRLYDVVSVKKKKNTYSFYCINDKKEKELKNAYELLSRDDSGKKRIRKFLKNIKPVTWFLYDYTLMVFNPFREILFVMPPDLYHPPLLASAIPPP